MTIREVSILKRILSLRSVFIINVLVLVGLLIGLGRTYWNNFHLKQEIDTLEAQAESLESKSIEIKKLKNYLGSQEFLENEARLKLGLQKPGEETIVIEGLGEKSNTRNDINSLDSKKIANRFENWLENPGKWWEYFFH